MTVFDWAAFEAELYDELRRALATLARKHRTQSFYAVALYGLSRELDGLLSLPLLGAATEAAGAPADADGFWGPRYNPEGWDFTEVDLRRKPALRIERALTAEATRGSPAHWRRVEARYSRVLVRIAGRLRDETPGLLAVTDDFVCFWHDDDGGPDLARKTIPRPLFERLFARQVDDARQRKEAAAKPAAERATFMVSRLGRHDGVTSADAEEALVAMGEGAIGALIAVLADPVAGWLAAKILGRIGAATPEIVGALRAHARVDAESAWHAMALGMLGDHAWLATQDPGVAVYGLCAPLKAITARGPPRRLDYHALERYLDGAGDAARALGDAKLKPGTSYVDIRGDDVGEAVRGLGSAHAVVRWHAAALLGDRSLGAAAGKRALPALANALADPHPIVRRLSLLSLLDWKAAAKPYFPAIRPLRDDPDEIVRRSARYALPE